MARRFTRATLRPRLLERRHSPEPVQVGWCRTPTRARRWCPACWADLSPLVVCDWCPACRRTLLMESQA